MFRTACSLLLLACMTPVLQYAQKTSTPSPAPSPNPTRPTTPTPTRPTTDLNNRTSRDSLLDGANPYYVTGKVVLDDGAPIPHDVTIEKVCNSRVRPLGFADRKGHFSVQMNGTNNFAFADASYDSMGGARQMSSGGRSNSSSEVNGCEVRASLPGYRSDTYLMTNRHSLDHPDIGILILHRLQNVPGTTISATALAAPKDATKAYEKGLEALQKNKVEDAEKQLRRAVEVYPTYAAAWYELGHLLNNGKDSAEARACFEKAIAADPKFVTPYSDLALISAREKKWEETIAFTDKGIGLDPVDFPYLFFFGAVAHYNLQQMEPAEKRAREGLKVDTKNKVPKLHQLLGTILASKGEYSEASEQMKAFLASSPNPADTKQAQSVLTEMEAHLTQPK